MADETTEEELLGKLGESEQQRASPVEAPSAPSFWDTWSQRASEYIGAGPSHWDRFKRRPGSGGSASGDKSAQDFPSGANVTLNDIARDPKDIELQTALPPGGARWVGTPDPAKFMPGTNFLSEEEIKEEMAKGNIMTLEQFNRRLEGLSPAEASDLRRRMSQDELRNTYLNVGDGKVASVWDLYQYTYNNPELDLLTDRTKGRVFPLARSPEDVLEGRDGGDGAQAEDGEASGSGMEAAEGWGRMGDAVVWRRKPTRWLRGIDGVPDFTVEMGAHEDTAHELLGPRWANGRRPDQVVADPEYRRAVVALGPQMGMSFIMTAARELSVEETRSKWLSQLALRLHAQQGVPQAPSLNALDQLAAHYDVGRLQRECPRLLDRTGSKLRQGASFTITTGPQGQLFMLADSPEDKAGRGRQHYFLGCVHDMPLATALCDLFVGSGEGCATPELREQALCNLLATAHGARDTDAVDVPHSLPAYFLPAKPSIFSLPAVGTARRPLLIKGVSDAALYSSFGELVGSALQAARAVPQAEGSDPRATLWARRAAAEQVMRTGLLSLTGLGQLEQQQQRAEGSAAGAGVAAAGAGTEVQAGGPSATNIGALDVVSAVLAESASFVGVPVGHLPPDLFEAAEALLAEDVLLLPHAADVASEQRQQQQQDLSFLEEGSNQRLRKAVFR